MGHGTDIITDAIAKAEENIFNKTISEINEVINNFYSHPTDKLYNHLYDELIIQRECLLEEDPPHPISTLKTRQNVIFVKRLLSYSRMLNFVYT